MTQQTALVAVTQKPILNYDLLEEKSIAISKSIDALNIDKIESTEENLKQVKELRANLKKDFNLIEDQRKLAKEIMFKDFNDFESKYKTLIKAKFDDADAKLKAGIDKVESGILAVKVDGLNAFFTENNTFDFLVFEDVGLKVTRSTSDKKYQDEITSFLQKIASDLKTIETMENKDRILAKFQINKDLNRAISETNIEIDRENQIKQQQELRAKQQAELAQQAEQVKPQQQEVIEPVTEPEPVALVDEKIYQTSFSIRATKAQIADLKEYLALNNIEIVRD